MPLSSCSSWMLAWTGGGGTLFFTARAPIPVGKDFATAHKKTRQE